MRLSLFLSLLGIAAASDNSVKREYSYKFEKDKIDIDAEYSAKDKDAGINDESKLSWVLGVGGDGFRNVAKGFAKTTDTKSNFEMDNKIREVIEYLPTNLDVEEPYNGEVAINTWKLDKWKDAVRVGSDLEPNTVTFESEDGFFKAIAKVNSGAFTAGGVLTVGIDDIKVDYSLDYPLASADNRLAILGTLVTKAKTKIKKEKEEASDRSNGIDLTDDATGVGGHFDWVTEIDCQDVNQNAVKRKVWSKFTDSGSDTKEVSFTYIKQKTDGACVWDPVYGVNIPNLSGAPTHAATSAAFFLLSLAALWFA